MTVDTLTNYTGAIPWVLLQTLSYRAIDAAGNVEAWHNF